MLAAGWCSPWICFLTAAVACWLNLSSSKTVGARVSHMRAYRRSSQAMQLTESELLQGPPVCLGVEEELENYFEKYPAAVDSEEFPANSRESNGVHIVRKEGG